MNVIAKSTTEQILQTLKNLKHIVSMKMLGKTNAFLKKVLSHFIFTNLQKNAAA